MIADREMNSKPLRVAFLWGQRFPGCCVLLLALALSASGAFAGNFGMYRSTDEGRTWVTVGKGLPRGLRVDALGKVGLHRLAGTEHGCIAPPHLVSGVRGIMASHGHPWEFAWRVPTY